MVRTIRARFSHGVIEPLEKVAMPEGKEVTITISETLTKEFIHEEEQRDKEWGNLAMSSFANDWDNEKAERYYEIKREQEMEGISEAAERGKKDNIRITECPKPRRWAVGWFIQTV